ncbi:MAG TPA: hypothetical protein VJ850_12895 [Candidatus Limnocylindrales bacterium]|nr:hypothetical protein [Candidatus Limnocylindrales bacterium]
MPKVARIAPVVAGVAGLAAFWAELAPQRAGFPDTDHPGQGLEFIAAQPGAWAVVGVAFMAFAVALVVTVLSVRARLLAASPTGQESVSVDALTVIGLFGALMAFGFGIMRMGAGPIQYIQGLDQSWGEAAYLVTQIAGVQLLEPGSFLALILWIVGVAWLGARRGVVPRVVAVLAVLPAFRLLGFLGPFGLALEELWIFSIVAIPAAYVWLALLGAWPGVSRNAA